MKLYLFHKVLQSRYEKPVLKLQNVGCPCTVDRGNCTQFNCACKSRRKGCQESASNALSLSLLYAKVHQVSTFSVTVICNKLFQTRADDFSYKTTIGDRWPAERR